MFQVGDRVKVLQTVPGGNDWWLGTFTIAKAGKLFYTLSNGRQFSVKHLYLKGAKPERGLGLSHSPRIEKA